MDLLRKIETLLNATARAGLPRRQRRTSLDEQEEKLLADLRQALAGVEAREREMATRLKTEQAQAQEAAQRGDQAAQRAHETRAAELERHLTHESTQAINLEEKLAALEEKLALAKAAVDKQARIAAEENEKLNQSLAMAQAAGKSPGESSPASSPDPTSQETIKEEFREDPPDLAARKSRLSE